MKAAAILSMLGINPADIEAAATQVKQLDERLSEIARMVADLHAAAGFPKKEAGDDDDREL